MRYILSFIIVVVFALQPAVGADKLQVITSTADLAYFARQIGGDLVEVESIAAPTADIHFVEARPSYMVKVARADVALEVGMELDIWMDNLIDGSRNSDLVIVNCSKYVEPMEVPTFKVDASRGDIHPRGNPHYWLGPDNVPLILEAIVEGFVTADPEHVETYERNAEQYMAALERSLEEMADLREQAAGIEVVFYHSSWPYFCAYSGVEAAGFVEPYPGVPPSPTHIKKLIDMVAARDIEVIAMEPYFDKRVPERIAGETGAEVVTVYPSVGGRGDEESYADCLRANLQAIVDAAK